MSPRVQANFRLDTELIDGLRRVYDRDGVLPSEQVRRAVRWWLEGKGALAPLAPPKKTARKRVAPRTRA
jgi:predicted metal-dependent hydrolase